MKKIYIAGPMRGYKDYNFPAFKSAKIDLELAGWDVLCPASHDLEEGFDVKTKEVSAEEMERYIKRDIAMIAECEAIALLPGFEKSKGALAERAVAEFLSKDIYEYPSMDRSVAERAMKVARNDVLVEALEITSGDRQNQYGAPDQDFARTAKMWSALKGVEFSTEEVASFLCCVKLSRNTHQSKRDNWVDLAGYARCGDICRQEKEKRNEVCT